jgi:uncharacterized membrane protein
MDESRFSIGDAFRFGWRIWKENWPLLVGAVLFSFLLPALPQLLDYALPEEFHLAKLALQILYIILLAIAQMGLLNITLRLAQGKSTTFSDFFSAVHLFPSYLLGWVLYYLAVGLGLIALIIPGIILALKFCLWPYFVIDRGYTGWDALKASNTAVWGSKWDLLLFAVGTFLLNILGLLFFGIGALVTIPVTLLAWAYVYLKLSAPAETHEAIE